jgi:tRNA(fMet)-specific endonuclease VapC
LALILADSDVLIDYLEGVQPVRDSIGAHLADDTLFTTAITAFELLSGAREGRKGDRVRSLVANLPVLPLDRESAERAAIIGQELEAEGRSIGMADSLIAGIAIIHNLPLFTRNRRALFESRGPLAGGPGSTDLLGHQFLDARR